MTEDQQRSGTQVKTAFLGITTTVTTRDLDYEEHFKRGPRFMMKLMMLMTSASMKDEHEDDDKA